MVEGAYLRHCKSGLAVNQLLDDLGPKLGVKSLFSFALFSFALTIASLFINFVTFSIPKTCYKKCKPKFTFLAEPRLPLKLPSRLVLLRGVLKLVKDADFESCVGVLGDDTLAANDSNDSVLMDNGLLADASKAFSFNHSFIKNCKR